MVQETVFARRVTVQFKGFVCPWEMFGEAAINYRQHRQKCCSRQYVELPPAELDILETFARTVNNLNDWRRVWDNDSLAAKDRKINLLQLLWHFRTRETGVPKDKVYALLPLVNDWEREDPIKIRYNFSDEAVFREVVNKMMSVCMDLSVLMGNTRTLHSPENGRNEPSWVTDWASQPDHRELERLLRAPLYRADGEEVPEWRILPGVNGEHLLELKGLAWDTVSDVAGVMPCEDDNAVSDMFEKWEIFLNLHDAPHQQYVDGGQLREAYWRTICMDTVFERKQTHNDVPPLDRRDYRLLDKQDHSYQSWLEVIDNLQNISGDNEPDMSLSSGNPTSSSKDDEGSFQPGEDDVKPELSRMTNYQVQVDEAIASATMHRRLFRTKQSYIGLGPEHLKQGDQIWVLKGGRVPFMLRPAGEFGFKRGVEGKRECHRLVGDCYVHGIMFGEAMQAHKTQSGTTWMV